MLANRIVSAVVLRAIASLGARSAYAADVLRGRQRWSGSDLRGKAARYGIGYARQRSKAAAALVKAGGCIIAVAHNRRVTAVRVCVDDYGSEVYATAGGFVRPASRHQCLPFVG